MGAISNTAALQHGVSTVVFGPLANGKNAAVNISVCNRSATAARVSVAISMAPAPTNAEYIEFDAMASQAAPLLRTGEVIKAGEYVVVIADSDACCVRVSGYEESEA